MVEPFSDAELARARECVEVEWTPYLLVKRLLATIDALRAQIGPAGLAAPSQRPPSVPEERAGYSGTLTPETGATSQTAADDLTELATMLVTQISRFTSDHTAGWAACYEAADAILSLGFTRQRKVTAVIDEIAAERRRQIDDEGWSPEHDDRHDMGELALAAASYAKQASETQYDYRISCVHEDIEAEAKGAKPHYVPRFWPFNWSAKWWKPKGKRRDLIRAGALIVAEIERLDRKEPSP